MSHRALRRLTRRRSNPLITRDHIKIAAEISGVGIFLLFLIQALRKP